MAALGGAPIGQYVGDLLGSLVVVLSRHQRHNRLDGSLRFVTVVLVTVPGKGGRPRKWRSDADRVRAYRARQRGEREPVTFDVALTDGDELALAIERGRQLQAELADAVAALAELDAALQSERRRHVATKRKLERTRADLEGHRAADDRRLDELRAVHGELEALRSENDQLRSAGRRSPVRTVRLAARLRSRTGVPATEREHRNETQRFRAPSG